MATERAKKRKLILDCEICGEPVILSKSRYVELVRMGCKPRCRKNGCSQLTARERSSDAKTPGTARKTEILATIEVPLLRMRWPKLKRGKKNGALAKLTVSCDEQWRYEAHGHND